MYTSGSTGNPKGVVVRHSQIVCLLEAIKVRKTLPRFFLLLSSLTLRALSHTHTLFYLQSKANLREGETLVGYLPLAHIFEMQV